MFEEGVRGAADAIPMRAVMRRVVCAMLSTVGGEGNLGTCQCSYVFISLIDMQYCFSVDGFEMEWKEITVHSVHPCRAMPGIKQQTRRL